MLKRSALFYWFLGLAVLFFQVPAFADQLQIGFDEKGGLSLLVQSKSVLAYGQVSQEELNASDGAYQVVPLDAFEQTREAGTGSGLTDGTELSPLGEYLQAWGSAELLVRCNNADVVVYRYADDGGLKEILAGTVKTTYCPRGGHRSE